MPKDRDKSAERMQEALRKIEDAERSGDTDLDLSHLGLTEIPESLARLTKLQRLHLTNNQIAVIPESLARLSNLEILYLAYNQIAVIPESLARLPILQTLYLHNNQIAVIPESLSRLSNLQDLALSNNQIAVIPESLSRLSNLKYLYLHNNQIAVIPESLARLSSLQYLHLDSNQIAVIPESLARLSNLRTLFLYNNQIAVIPESLALLSNLQTLNLSDNQIAVIPESLARLKNLEGLFLRGNPDLGISDEILGPTWLDVSPDRPSASPKAILNYYFSQRQDSRPLHEAKLILVGQGGVGKTSLVKTLLTRKFNRREKTTEGIKISDWSFTLHRKDKISVHIWDFGGQEMQHATHRFFLTRRALYLLVLNRRQGGIDKEADYWFRLIRAAGGEDAAVIVVLNKQKGEPFDVNRAKWLEDYRGHIKGFVETDCADVPSITRLRRKIELELGAMPDLQLGFPNRWSAIKKALSGMKQGYISLHEYCELCKSHNVGDAEKQTELAGHLHNLGVALNYGQDAHLHSHYVLKPEWVTEGIYALLHAPVKTHGLLTHARAAEILKGKKYPPDATDFILGLMEHFELSFKVDNNRTLIPQLLEDSQPPAAQEFGDECLRFGYQYPVIPEGLVPRFIVRTHFWSGEATRWKSGVILKDPDSGCEALVRSDAVNDQVQVRVKGDPTRRNELLAVIRHNFDAVHTAYQFKAQELVYVEDKPQLVEELKILRSGQTEITVASGGKRVQAPIDDLLAPLDSPEPLKVFVSYAHKDDKRYIDEIRTFLAVLKRRGLVESWTDHFLTAGEPWEERILQELRGADVVICQISIDFLASDYCMLTEVPEAFKRKAAGEAELIAYVLHGHEWKDEEFAKFQVLPKSGKPLEEWSNKRAYWNAVTQGIKEALEAFAKRRPRGPERGFERKR